jgi:N-acetylglutamate synthase-like GNAT family acetyltransferase
MTSELLIRPAVRHDAEAISRVIVRALRETNTQDYPSEIIASVASNFSPERVGELMGAREVLVAVLTDEIVGTASLQGAVVRTVFIAPDHQACGIGTALMQELERRARQGGIAHLMVPSSITAEGFYAKLGFSAIRDEFHGAERTIIMQKVLGEAAP